MSEKDEIRRGLLTHFPPELSGSQTEWLLLIQLQHPPFPEQQTHIGKTLHIKCGIQVSSYVYDIWQTERLSEVLVIFLENMS